MGFVVSCLRTFLKPRCWFSSSSDCEIQTDDGETRATVGPDQIKLRANNNRSPTFSHGSFFLFLLGWLCPLFFLLSPSHTHTLQLHEKGDRAEEWMKCPRIVPRHHCVFCISIIEVPLDFSSAQWDWRVPRLSLSSNMAPITGPRVPIIGQWQRRSADWPAACVTGM